MYLAMEFVKNGDLRSYLRKQRKAKHNLYANTKIISPVQQTMLLKFAFDAQILFVRCKKYVIPS
jgi:hypothetical protein